MFDLVQTDNSIIATFKDVLAMPHLDLPTLLTALMLAFFLVAILTLLAALYPRRSQTLLWFFNGFLVGGVGYLVVFFTGDFAQSTLTVWLETALAILAHGCLWIGMRAFSGKGVSWLGLTAGPVLWLLICLGVKDATQLGSPWIVNTYSLLASAYTLAAMHEFMPALRARSWTVLPMFVLLLLHTLYNLFRMLPIADLQTILLTDQLEGLLFVIASAFAALVMVYTRTQLQYLHDSLHDSLTGLFNRRALFREVKRQQAARQGGKSGEVGQVAMLMCDLDWFKQVNDSLGHETGDKVLSLFAEALRLSIRSGDICARLGGEEFAVLAFNLDEAGAQHLAERIRASLAELTRTLPVEQTVSIGLACFANFGTELGIMLKCADQALYQAKKDGRNCVREWQHQYARAQETMQMQTSIES